MFAEYRALVEPVSECPGVYHFANLLAVLSAEFGDRVVLAEGTGWFLNFYIFCCGVSGTKKSTASDLANDCVVRLLPERMHTRLSAISSAEGLIRTLGSVPNVFLCFDELKDFLTVAARAGNNLEACTNKAFWLGDLQTVVKRSRESLSASNYYFNMLLNGTPKHVELDMSTTMFLGGLLNRMLVFGGLPTDKKMARMLTPDMAKAQALATKIAEHRNAWMIAAPNRRSVFIDFGDEAAAMHKAWYDAMEDKKRGLDELSANPVTRLDVYFKKLASMYCMLESTPSASPRISIEQTAAALDVVTYCEASMSWMSRHWSGAKTMSQQSEALAEQRVEAYILVRGCMTERELYRGLHLSITDCAKAINALVAMGVVNVVAGRPRMIHCIQQCKCAVTAVTA